MFAVVIAYIDNKGFHLNSFILNRRINTLIIPGRLVLLVEELKSSMTLERLEEQAFRAAKANGIILND